MVDLQAFGFGDRVEEPGHAAAPEYSLHVQCRWRIVRGASIVVGSADIFWPLEGSDGSYRDFDYDGRRSRRDELLDGFLLHGDAAHIVKSIEGGSTGDARVTLEDGCVLELWPDHRSGVEADGPFEHWRFFRRADTHFVVTASGIEI